LVIVCTVTGASPPTGTLPTMIWREGRRAISRQGRTDMRRLPLRVRLVYKACQPGNEARRRCGSRSIDAEAEVFMLNRLSLAALLAAVPAIALAHHGWSSYDADKTITHTAALRSVTWGNPHGTAKVVYQRKVWDVILAPTPRMEARGLQRAMLGPRGRVTLVGYPRKDGAAEMRIERVIVGGKTVELR
jgi:hypothetical protein